MRRRRSAPYLPKAFRHKLTLYETHDSFGDLVGAKSTGLRGIKALSAEA